MLELVGEVSSVTVEPIDEENGHGGKVGIRWHIRASGWPGVRTSGIQVGSQNGETWRSEPIAERRYSPSVLTLGAFLVLMDRISVTLSRTSIHPEVTRHAAHRCNNRRNIAKKRAVPPQRPSYVPSELQLGGDPRRCGSDVAGQTSGSLPTRSLNLPTVTCPSVFLLFRINAGGQTSAHIAKPQGSS
jgi:hypothetical protein